MTLDEIVVDTNVLVQAENPGTGQHAPSLALLERLEGGETSLCLEEGFDVTESKNKSAIYSEYLQFLSPQTYPLQLIAGLASAGRLALKVRPPAGIKSVVRRLIPHDMTDRRFLEMAYQSTSRTLISHDFDDFHEECRRRAMDALSVHIVEAADVVDQI